ncbi:MAG: hypothetical protein HY532_01475, partial [Chloroflexi bacterium]|nr:hypothetical protein [Chloroflexota bacterium]
MVIFGIRIGPIQIGRRMAAAAQSVSASVSQPARPLGELLRLPAVLPAFIAAVLAQGVMAALMSVTGLIMIGHGHDVAAVPIVMSAHFLGMFGLVLVAGQLVDRLA